MFSFKRSNTGHNFPAIKEFQAKASTTYAVGDALVLTAGVLEIASGTTKPQYICAEKYTAPATGMKKIAVYVVADGQEWETTFSAAATSIAPGNAVTISEDGKQATATTTSGVFTVLEMAGTAIGSAVVGKF